MPEMSTSGDWMNWTPPPAQAAHLTGFMIKRQPWAHGGADWKVSLQAQIDRLGYPPRPFDKPHVLGVTPDALMLSMVNVHITEDKALDNSLDWAWLIAAQAGLSRHDYYITPVWTYRLTA